MIIAAVDLGKARTGIAVCDKTEFLASPHTVIFEKSPEKLFEKVKETVVNLKSEIVVVGLPKIWTAVRARVRRTQEPLRSVYTTKQGCRWICRTKEVLPLQPTTF